MSISNHTTAYTKLSNIYYERKAGTERACYVCRMPTTTVLATLKSEDFLYVCPKHLEDSVTPIPEPTPSGPTAEEIAKVVKEHEEKEAQRRKAAAEKDGKASDSAKEKEKDELFKPTTATGIIPPSAASVSESASASTLIKATGGHRRYALHRGIFTMRQRELRAREQGVQAKEKSKGAFFAAGSVL
ncbi:hypothetical protein QFC21_001624 [Naganishia friedmannii]|uniref:Uncharacterized protein n=1 Tax=Naganishia friedmannii TaxID=89922 RepID=A0ACC2W3P2_9TREE|nr:hypothetical protein QFC21_001624 [Naganishia friedmannii]